MKSLLIAVDAKYIQTNLAVRSISAYVEKCSEFKPEIVEFTINQPTMHMLDTLYRADADLYLFSSYIWNIEMIKTVAADLIKIRPHAKIFLGGPEATYHAEKILHENPAITGIMVGEGEATVLDLLHKIEHGEDLSTCCGLYLSTGYTAPRSPLNMDDLPFAYTDKDGLSNRIIYYESMRGCPFGCTYCLSSVEKGVHFRSLSLVYQDLQLFLKAKVPQVKFVDRTFNCKKSHAMGIWSYLKKHDNGITNFHFELAGELVDEEMIALLATLRPGLCQFEIGVQSTNTQTLEAIQRPWDFEKLAEKVYLIHKAKNIHLHLDLIAGLPYEDFHRFASSFNDVYSLRPQQLQLGFLKVLGGSRMEEEAPSYGLLYQEAAPYEVLQTNWISFEELSVLHGVDDMVDHYYNSGRYSNIIEAIVGENPFQFYLSLSAHFNKIVGDKPLSKIGYYDLLGSYLAEKALLNEELQWLCKYDLLLHENLRKVPNWVTVDLAEEYRERIRLFYDNPNNIARYLPQYTGSYGKHISRITRMEIFPFHPETREQRLTGVLFDYDTRNLLGNARVSFHSF